jgi:tetratricopeptide (TPR) repeat protein
MRSTKILIIITVFLGFTFMGYQCGSTEITSAKLYIQQKNFDKALELLQQEVQKNPKSDEGYYLLGYVHGEKEQYTEMMDAYNRSLSISKNYVTQINESKQFYWAALFNRGVKAYQDGVNSNDDDSSKVFLGRAANFFQQAINILPDSADTYKNLAFVHLSTGNFNKAEEPLRKCIEKEQMVDCYRYLGEILYEKGLNLMETDEAAAMRAYDDAIEVLEEGRKNHPGNADILLVLANSYISANKLDVAKDIFKAGVDSEPENQYYRYNYGVLLLGANEFEEAERQFLKAIEIDPDYVNALYNLAVTYVKWGTTLNKEAEDAGITDNTYKDKYNLALPYLEKVVQLQPSDASSWELLGRVYTVLGMQDDAANAFNKADQLRQ